MGVRDELDADLRAILPAEWFGIVERREWESLRALQAGVGSQNIVRELGRRGWIAPHWPVEHGGRGLSDGEAGLAIARLDELVVPRIPRGTGFVLAAPAIRQFASEETKRRFLPKIVTGEEMWAQLFSEPGAGSDLASLACRAVRDGGEWVVSGQKVWTTLGHEADIGMLLARTDPDAPKNKGITYFAVDLRASGAELRPLIQMTGEHEFNEVFLSDVRIPDLWRISPVNEGWAASNASLAAERITLSGQKAGGPQKRSILGGKTIDEVLALARERGLTATQRERLVEAWIDAKVLGLTVGRMKGPAGSITKVMKAKSNQELQCLALEILGADAAAWEGDATVEYAKYVREFLRTRANSIEGGTSEIQRNIIGERVLGLPREPDPWVGQPWKDVPRS
ncbi:MAG: acyl-CoA dehydrogenase family protein [Actinomycetota bacterium]